MWRPFAVAMVALTSACGTSPAAPSASSAASPSAPGAPTLVQTAITQHYERLFGEKIPWPAVFDDFVSGCGNHVTTTAYVRQTDGRSRLLEIYTSRDGGSVISSRSATVRTPAGTFRVVTLLVNYPQTLGSDAISSWQAAQAQINLDHASFAQSRGYGAPLVRFDNTTVLLGPSQVTNPRALSPVMAALQQNGVDPGGYDFVASVNIDPSRSEGGFSTPGSTPGFIYMGNYSNWTAPLSPENWNNVSRAVYNHEVSHHWGWPGTHDWSCSTPPTFIVPPVLLGWEDVDGDHVPEIIDPTPYGRS